MKSRSTLLLAFAMVMIIVFSLFPNKVILASEVTNTPEESSEESNTEEESEFPEVYYLPIQSNDTPGWPEGPQILSEAAIVMDANTGAILYEKNIDSELYPASITKIMTLLLALENSKLDEVVTFSEYAVYSLTPGSANIGIREGEQLTMEQCLYGLMLASANEVANAIAEHIAGSVQGFAAMMNEKAAELGCQHTHFANPHGLHDDEHYTSAYDMALITKAALETPGFLTFIGEKQYTIPTTNIVDEERPLRNHHKMLTGEGGYGYDGCIGGKTGYTDNAYNTLVTLSSKDNIELICVTLMTNGADISYQTTTQLLNYVYDNFTAVSIQDNDPSFIESDFSLLKRGTYLKQDARTLVTVTGNNTLILPNNINFSQLKHTLTYEENSLKVNPTINYFCNGRFLGSTSIQIHPLIEGIVDIEGEDDTSDSSDDIVDTESDSQDEITSDSSDDATDTSTEMAESTSDDTLETESFFEKSLSNKVKTIINTPRYLAYVIIGFIILILTLFIIIRLVKNHHVQKRRRSKNGIDVDNK